MPKQEDGLQSLMKKENERYRELCAFTKPILNPCSQLPDKEAQWDKTFLDNYIFSVHQIPTTHHICNLLDHIPLKTVFALLVGIGDGWYQQGYLESFRAVNGTLLAALDGTDFSLLKKAPVPAAPAKRSTTTRPYTGTPPSYRC